MVRYSFLHILPALLTSAVVTDRLGWINFVEGALARTLAVKIDASRASFKALRDSENTLAGRRSIRAGLYNQIGRIESDQSRGYEQKVAELRQQLARAETDDQPLENEFELLKRKAIRDSERAKWEAVREVCGPYLLFFLHTLIILVSTGRSWFSSRKQQSRSSRPCLQSLLLTSNITVPRQLHLCGPLSNTPLITGSLVT